jgi:hypothetical protein
LALPLSGKAPAVKNATNWFSFNPFGNDTAPALFTELQKRGWLSQKNITDMKGPIYQSENGELTVNGPANVFTLDTPCTAGGFAPAGTTITTKSVSASIMGTEATVWVSSLDNNPIIDSQRLLITHLTDLQNTDIKYAEKARRTLYAWGKLPHLVREGQATVTLSLRHPEKARVWGLATDGTRLAPIATRIENGKLVVPLDVNNNGKARMQYEVVVR